MTVFRQNFKKGTLYENVDLFIPAIGALNVFMFIQNSLI